VYEEGAEGGRFVGYAEDHRFVLGPSEYVHIQIRYLPIVSGELSYLQTYSTHQNLSACIFKRDTDNTLVS